jgi:CBS domain-containing protein
VQKLDRRGRPGSNGRSEELKMKVKDVMTTSVASVRSDEPLSVAAQLMWDCDCGALPVRDRSSERIIGMITDRDICMAAWSQDRSPRSITVLDAMSPRLYSAAPEETVASAEYLMRSKQIRRLPVLDEGWQLVGIISLADIALAAQRRALPTAASELAPAEIASTLASICRPRPHVPTSTSL